MMTSTRILLAFALVSCAPREPDDSAARERRGAAGSERATRAEPAANEPVREEPARAAQANAAPAPSGPRNPALLQPNLAQETAPAHYSVKLETTKGDVFIDVTRAWAPLGADRFYNLVRIGAYDDVAFFRVIAGFMAQVGLNGDPAVNRAWRTATIQDDPPSQSNTRGMVTFATSGPNSRTNQFFINFGNNARLDPMGFAPFGRVRDMSAIDALYSGYGEGAPRGRGPAQGQIQNVGNPYLRREFPNLDYIRRATIVPTP